MDRREHRRSSRAKAVAARRSDTFPSSASALVAAGALLVIAFIFALAAFERASGLLDSGRHHAGLTAPERGGPALLRW